MSYLLEHVKDRFAGLETLAIEMLMNRATTTRKKMVFISSQFFKNNPDFFTATEVVK